MNKLMYLTILLLVLIFTTGCGDSASILESPSNEQNGENVLAKRTILNQIEEIVPFAGSRFIPCANGGAGEDVAITGTAKLKVVEFLDGNGGYHYRLSFQTLEYGGVGQTTGDVYRGVGGKERQNLYVGPTGLPVSTNFTANYNYHGPNNNFREKFHINLVYNANGELTANFYSLEIDCN